MKFLPDKMVELAYRKNGLRLGAMLSYLSHGKPVGFGWILRKTAFWEKEYARRGYRTLPIVSFDSFEDAGGWGKPLPPLGTKRESQEKAKLPANDFFKNYPTNLNAYYKELHKRMMVIEKDGTLTPLNEAQKNDEQT